MTSQPSISPRRSRRSARPLQPASARGDRVRRRAGEQRAGSGQESRLRRRRRRQGAARPEVGDPAAEPDAQPPRLESRAGVARRPPQRAAQDARRRGRGELDRARVVAVDDRPVVRPLEGDDAALGLEVGREAAVLVDVIGPHVRDAGDLRTGRADGQVVRRQLGDAPGRRPRREGPLEQVGRRPGVVGGRVARGQRLDAARRSMASARRAVVVLPALPVTPSTGTGE